MATFKDLPFEIIEMIYLHLGSIDDVHSLGRAFKYAYAVMQERKEYLDIMRAIIYHSPCHRFDVQLCQMLDLHRDIVQHFQGGGPPFKPTLPSPLGVENTNISPMEERILSSFSNASLPEGPSSISDNRVCEILARWQGLRLLQDLWLARDLDEADYLPVDFTQNPKTFVDAYTVLQERYEDPEPPPELYCNFDHRTRFHSSITRLWLMNELRWVWTNFTYPPSRFAVQLRISQICMDKLNELDETPLLDHLDTYSMYTFLYHHLLPLHSRVLADGCSSKLPLTFSSDLSVPRNIPRSNRDHPIDTAHNVRFLQMCLSAGQTYLQPPDIIDLVVRSKLMQLHPLQVSDFHVPASTQEYTRPYTAYYFNSPLPNQNPTASANYPRFLMESVGSLSLIQRATYVDLRRMVPATVDPSIEVPVPRRGELFQLNDLFDEWFFDKIVKLHPWLATSNRPGLVKDLKPKWKKDARWRIWWWANSDAKADMKIVRWKESLVGRIEFDPRYA
jgi:hypothetical protein